MAEAYAQDYKGALLSLKQWHIMSDKVLFYCSCVGTGNNPCSSVAKDFSDFYQLYWILCWRSVNLRSPSRIARRRSLLNSFVLASEAVWCSCYRYDSLSR